jgi:ADP-ribose pyrophosphatase
MKADSPETQVLFQGQWLKLQKRGTWEFVSRTNPGGACVIIAVTGESKVLLVEQFRRPINARTIEFPAGLIGDDAAFENESAATSAARELEEETGFRPKHVRHIHSGPSSAGMSTEYMHFYRASGLEKVSSGGGVVGEDITVHEVAIDQISKFVSDHLIKGFAVDPKVFAGIHFLHFDPLGNSLPAQWWIT